MVSQEPLSLIDLVSAKVPVISAGAFHILWRRGFVVFQSNLFKCIRGLGTHRRGGSFQVVFEALRGHVLLVVVVVVLLPLARVLARVSSVTLRVDFTTQGLLQCGDPFVQRVELAGIMLHREDLLSIPEEMAKPTFAEEARAHPSLTFSECDMFCLPRIHAVCQILMLLAFTSPARLFSILYNGSSYCRVLLCLILVIPVFKKHSALKLHEYILTVTYKVLELARSLTHRDNINSAHATREERLKVPFEGSP
mmetsp:Transcript_13843/g.26870  ORF Transcript_13843/g.26870 Transcript_13843/m.26870 type:complete len:252 (+) Transcript_13843:1741-2496(+)